MRNIITLLAAMLPIIPDGTILFFENTQAVVEAHTKTSLTHVAVIMNEDGKPFVYEATRPAVRKLPLETKLAEVDRLNARMRRQFETTRIKVWAGTPKRTFTTEESVKVKKYLESQLGRDYSVRSYVTGVERFTIHCCELVSNAMNTIMEFSTEPPRETPIKLWSREYGEKLLIQD